MHLNTVAIIMTASDEALDANAKNIGCLFEGVVHQSGTNYNGTLVPIMKSCFHGLVTCSH